MTDQENQEIIKRARLEIGKLTREEVFEYYKAHQAIKRESEAILGQIEHWIKWLDSFFPKLDPEFIKRLEKYGSQR